MKVALPYLKTPLCGDEGYGVKLKFEELRVKK